MMATGVLSVFVFFGACDAEIVVLVVVEQEEEGEGNEVEANKLAISSRDLVANVRCCSHDNSFTRRIRIIGWLIKIAGTAQLSCSCRTL